MKTAVLPLFVLFPAAAALAADFKRDIMPILKAECYKCHSEELGKEKGGFVFDNLTRFGKDIGPGRIIEPGKVDESHFYETLINPTDEDSHMPPKKNLSAAQVAKFKEWIAEGASFDGGKRPVAGTTQVAPAAPATTAPPIAQPVMQAWTNTEGRIIQAAMLRMEGENVVLQMAGGQTYSYPLSKLSPQSQELAKRGGK